MTVANDQPQSIAIVGAGMAGARLAEKLIDAGCRNSITLIGEEPAHAYNRIQLSSVLAGNKSLGDLPLLSEDWYRTHGIKVILDDPVVDLDTQSRTLRTRSEWQQAFDTLVLATGSKPLIPELPGIHLGGVMAFRNLQDIAAMQNHVSRHAAGNGRVFVIGGGLLGLEAAYGLNRQGLNVTVIHNSAALMNRQLDARAADLLRANLERRGIEIVTNAKLTKITGTDSATGIRIEQEGGAESISLSGELVVFATGIRPNIDLAENTDLSVNRGVLVNDRLQTSAANIYAVGECCEHRGRTVGIVAPIWDQVDVLVKNLMGEAASYQPRIHATQLKVSGIDVFAAGPLTALQAIGSETGRDDLRNSRNIVLHDPKGGVYRRLVIHNNRLQAAMLFGDKSQGSFYEQLIDSGQPLPDGLDQLMFSGPAASSTPMPSTTMPAASAIES